MPDEVSVARRALIPRLPKLFSREARSSRVKPSSGTKIMMIVVLGPARVELSIYEGTGYFLRCIHL